MALPALRSSLRKDVLVAQPIREEVRALRLAKMDRKLKDPEPPARMLPA
jgi:hypothetical protein